MTIEELLHLLEPMIQKKAKMASIHSMEWEDIAQELRIVVIKKQSLFFNGKSSPQTFAQRVFRNRIIELWRQANTKPEVDNEEALMNHSENQKNFNREVLEQMCLRDALVGLLASFNPETKIKEILSLEHRGDIDLVKMFQSCI